MLGWTGRGSSSLSRRSLSPSPAGSSSSFSLSVLLSSFPLVSISASDLYTGIKQSISWYNRVATTGGIEYLVYQASRGSLCSTMQIYAGYIINYVPYTLHSLYTRQPQPGNQNMYENHKNSPKGADIRWEPVYDGTGPRTSALGYPAKHHSSAIAVKVVWGQKTVLQNSARAKAERVLFGYIYIHKVAFRLFARFLFVGLFSCQ